VKIEIEPIGFIRADIEKVPRHWTVSDAEGSIVIDDRYKEGLRDIKAGQTAKRPKDFVEFLRFPLCPLW
jgi:tRNA (Thr-GGU) A37 N-methylase